MGVPAFFRWVSEKYPKITQPCVEEDPAWIQGQMIPVDASLPNPNGMEFDNLYLDMNGIIHPCTHPEQGEAPPTMDAMFIAIGIHIDRLFRLVRPRNLLYMAIDGIAPRAKMNQQRSRRFRAALEAEEARADMEKVRKSMTSKGLQVPPGKPAGFTFDSNVITPGTEFMDRLATYLRYFIIDKQAMDPAWASCKVILSDAQSPGEGEHKIMQFIRRQRAEPGHDPNTHHVMYGLDADLIMLGLASHEVRFTVLRDQVLFGKKNRGGGAKQDQVLGATGGGTGENAEEVTGGGAFATTSPSISKLKPIEMLHVWVLREYLQHEFRVESFEGALQFEYDFERCVDDFVFLCFFVGNDFLPHLPSLAIREGGLELLINVYRKVLPTLSGFLTEDGDVDLGHVDALMRVLGTVEDRIFALRRSQEDREKHRKRQVQSSLHAGGSNVNVNSTAQQNSKRIKSELSTMRPNAIDPSELVTLSEKNQTKPVVVALVPPPAPPSAPPSAQANKSAAAALRAKLSGGGESKPEAKPETKTEVTASAEESSDASKEIEKVLPDEPAAVGELEEVVEEEELFGDEISYENRLKSLAEKRNVVADETTIDQVRFGEAGWKDRYYETKFGKEQAADTKFRRQIVESYVRGLCWVIQYYYKGCQSWKWFFEFHYAPFASDLTDLASIDMTWPASRPFKPFEQLMAVLPPQSAHALPESCRTFMTDENSPVADFYPRTIQFDPDGKPVRWLWIALLPFIEESRLLDVAKKCEKSFNMEEKRRNAMMPDLLFVPRDAPGANFVASVLTQSPPNLLPNWESDQIAILARSKEEELHLEGCEEPLNLPAPTTAGDARGGGSARVYASAIQAGGLSGFFLPVAPEFTIEVEQKVVHPFDSSESVFSLSFVCEFRLPPLLPHLSRLCPGVTMPASVLNDEDLRIRRPRMSNVDVSNLLVADNPNYSGLERSWGSAEPQRYNRNEYRQPPPSSLQGTGGGSAPSYGGNPFAYPPPPLIGNVATGPPPVYAQWGQQQQQQYAPQHSQQQQQQGFVGGDYGYGRGGRGGGGGTGQPPQGNYYSGSVGPLQIFPRGPQPPASLLVQLQATLNLHQDSYWQNQQQPPPQQHYQQPQQQYMYPSVGPPRPLMGPGGGGGYQPQYPQQYQQQPRQHYPPPPPHGGNGYRG